jgi:hypothetical protein
MASASKQLFVNHFSILPLPLRLRANDAELASLARAELLQRLRLRQQVFVGRTIRYLTASAADKARTTQSRSMMSAPL